MPLTVTHSTVVAQADDGTSPVGSDEWNAAHTVTGSLDVSDPLTVGTVIGGTGNATLTLESTSGVGTTDKIVFKTGSQVEALRIDSAQRLSQGGFANDSGAGGNSELQLVGTASTAVKSVSLGANTSANGLYFAKTRGAAPSTQTICVTGDNILDLTGYASDGASYQQVCYVRGFLTGTVGAGATPGQIRMATTPASSTTPVVGYILDKDGSTQLGAPAGTPAANGVLVKASVISEGANGGSFGFSTGRGAGDVVTQGSSRTTTVVLNKPTGAITMFSAAGSATAATFTVTNSTVAATDVIVLNQKSGTNLYNFIVTAVAAGSFNITFFTTGGTAVDAPVINFFVLKGAST